MTDKIIAVDFDGTLCEDAYPEIGQARYDVMQRLYEEMELGAKVILWTCRTGKRLKEAVVWCEEYGILFNAVNENLPEVIAEYGGADSRKVTADEYWDDKSVNVNY